MKIPSLSIAILFVLQGILAAADWPHYRGPEGDGSSPEPIRTDWDARSPRVVWKRAIDPAWSSVTVSGGKVFTQVNRRVGGQRRELCVALDTASGAELWSAELDTAFYPDGGTGSTDGPRSTPTVEGDRVYVLTSYLKLYCLRADTGAVVWSRDFLAEFPGTSVILWQNAASPLVVGDRVFLNCNVANQCLMAVQASDGKTLWSGQNDVMTHSSPVRATLGGIPQVVFVTSRGTLGLSPETGDVLWRHSFAPSSTSIAASPVVANDIVYASCAYALGAWTAKVTRSGSTFTVSQTDFKRSSAHQNHWASPVHHEGHLYSIVERSMRSLACFSLAGRTNTWITSTVGSGNPGYGSLIKVGGKLVVLTERGELVVVEPNPTAYSEIARFQTLSGTSWNHPAFSNGKLYARSNIEIVALDLGATAPPLPPLRLAAELRPGIGRIALRVTAPGGLALSSTEASRIRLETSAIPSGGPPIWRPATLEFLTAPADGALEAEMDAPDNSILLRVAERRSQ